MRTMTVLTATTLLALGAMSPAGATYEGQEGRIAFGAFVSTDRTQGDIGRSDRTAGHCGS